MHHNMTQHPNSEAHIIIKQNLHTNHNTVHIKPVHTKIFMLILLKLNILNKYDTAYN